MSDDAVRAILGDLEWRISTMPLIPSPPRPAGRSFSERYIARVFRLPQRVVLDRPPPWKGARSTARHHRQVKQRH